MKKKKLMTLQPLHTLGATDKIFIDDAERASRRGRAAFYSLGLRGKLGNRCACSVTHVHYGHCFKIIVDNLTVIVLSLNARILTR